MGREQLTERRYRRTPPPARRPPPGRLPTGRRLVVVLVGLALLAGLALLIALVGGDDDTTAGSTTATTATTTAGGGPPSTAGRAPDSVVARQLLPATLGPGWIEVSREPEPTAAEVDPDDPCSATGQPIPRGLVVRASFDRVTTAVVEQASLVAGVVEEGVEVPRLDEPAVVDCLEAGLEAQLTGETQLRRAEIDLPAAPEGAELTGARFELVRDGEAVGRFELLLLRRDRAVSFAIVVVQDAAQATPLDDLVAVLDAPLAAGAARLN